MKNNFINTFFSSPVAKSKIKSANVSFKEMLFGYFIGPFGALLASGIFTSYINYYFTDVVFAGETNNPAVSSFLSLLPLLSTVLIVIGNLVMGQLLEKTKTKQGKARPWILLSSITLTISCVLLFIIPFSDVIFKMIWIAIAYNLYYAVAYPIYNTANSTLIPLSTRNSKHRGLLASFTNVAGLAVMGAGSMVFPIIASIFLKTPISWTIAFVLIGIVSFICCLLQYYFTRERVSEEIVDEENKVEKKSIKEQLKGVVNNKFWWIIIIFYLFCQLGGAIKNISMIYFCTEIVDNSFWNVDVGANGLTQTLLSIAGAVPMAIASVLVWPLSNKFGKRIVTFIGMVIGVMGGIIAIIGESSVVAVTIGIALKCLGSAPACYMILAMISDVLDHLEAKNGYRSDGLTMSIYSSIMVAATGIATALFNSLIQGYDSNAVGNQIESVNTAISFSYLWVETIAYAVCGILILFFTVENNLEKDQALIIERQKEATLARGEVWIEPSEKLRLEQLEFDRLAEESRIAELKEKCKKKGWDFEEMEAKYQAKKNKK